MKTSLTSVIEAIVSIAMVTYFTIGAVEIVRAEIITPTRENFEISVQVKYMSPIQSFEYCKSLGMWPGISSLPKGVKAGCNLYYPEKRLCVIVTPKPIYVDDAATTNLGHELDHCVRGDYHPTN